MDTEREGDEGEEKAPDVRIVAYFRKGLSPAKIARAKEILEEAKDRIRGALKG